MSSLSFPHARSKRPHFGRAIKFAKSGIRSLLSFLSEPVADAVEQANEARDRRDWPTAARFYAFALERGSPNPALHVQLGHALKESGDYAGAEVAYRRYLEIEPGDVDIHLQLGHLFNRQHKLDVALHWYEAASALAPSNIDVSHHLETCKHRLSRQQDEATRSDIFKLIEKSAWQPARQMLRDLLANGRNADLIGILANVTKECGEFEEAEKLYAQYRTYARDNAPQLKSDAELQTAHLHRAAGDLSKALHHYILARHYDLERDGFLPEGAPSDREVRACIKEIYTCFWDCKSA